MTARAKYEVVSDAEGAFSYLNTHFSLPRTEQHQGLVQLRDGKPIAACLYVGFNVRTSSCTALANRVVCG